MHKGYISNNEMQQIYTQNDVSLSYKSDIFFYTLKRENNIFYYICITLSRTRQIESKSLFALVCKVFAIYLRIHI